MALLFEDKNVVELARTLKQEFGSKAYGEALRRYQEANAAGDPQKGALWLSVSVVIQSLGSEGSQKPLH